jgi:hypothetical protein
MMPFITILFLAALLRLSFLSTPSSDDMVHLWNVRLRARHGNLKSHAPLDSVLEGNRGYPALSHYLISLFPKQYWRLAGKLLNIGYDLVLVIATWVCAVVVLPSSSFPVHPAFVAMAAMATSPLLLPINSRVKSMGARTLGNVFVFGYLLCLWSGLQGDVAMSLVGMILLGVTIALSSKFAFQFILLTAPFLALFCGSWLPVLGIGGVVLGVFVVPGLGLREVLSFMIAHSKWYVRNYQTVSSVSSRNRLKDWLDLPRVFREQNGVFWNTLFRRSSYFIALYSFPVVIAIPLLTPAFPVLGGETGLIGYGTSVVSATLCVFVLTSLRPFLFLGQAERYLEYSLPLAAILFALAFQVGVLSVSATIGILCFQISMSLANLAYSHYATIRNALSSSGNDASLSFLDDLRGRRILAIPVKLGFLLSYESQSDNTYYYRAINMPGKGFKYLEQDLSWFEMPRPDFAHFYETYGIDTVVLDKQFLPRAMNRGIHYPVDRYETIVENDRYLVVDISRGPDQSA